MNEVLVTFHEHEQIADEVLKYAVIMARHEDKWIFCRHKDRDTLEIPGGHRELGENIDYTAERELIEETGAIQFSITPICIYSVTINSEETFGKLYFSEILTLGALSPLSEITEIFHLGALPVKLTYPFIQPHLYKKMQMWLELQSAKNER